MDLVKAAVAVVFMLAAVCVFLGLRVFDAYGTVQAAGERVRILEDSANTLAVRALEASAALEAARADAMLREEALAQDRAQARRMAARATATAENASRALRATLDSLGASSAALDSLEASHEAHVHALEVELQAADSTTEVVRGLLEVTEEALAAERVAHLATRSLAQGLREQVAAQNRRRKREAELGGCVVGGLAGVAVTGSVEGAAIGCAVGWAASKGLLRLF